jgi:S1-C subfamily serine protease
VSTADWVVIVVVVVSALYGLTTGLVRGALSLAGFALGAYVGARLAPALLSDGSPYAPLVALFGAVLGGALLRGLAGILGSVLRTTLSAVPGLRTLDSIAGLLLGAAAGVVLCWAVGAVLLYLPGQADMRRAVQRSEILAVLNDAFPPERLLETLERVDPIGVFAGPPAIVAPPDSRLARDPDVVAAAKSVVRVTGIACGLGVEGSGWIVRPGLVVTNAHVVAGIGTPRVDRRDGNARPAAVVVFDETNDVAVLRVPGLGGRALAVAEPERGVGVVLLGYPGNGPLTLTPGRLGGTRDLLSRNAYGRGPVRRSITTIRGVIEPGSSGGPGVDAHGRVRTTVFARQPGSRGGFGIPPDVVLGRVRKAAREPVPETACT